MGSLNKKEINLVIFDFDGVVLDSANIKTEAFAELFGDYPHHKESIISYHLQNQGISRYKKFEWIYENLFSKKISGEESKMLGEEFSKIAKEKILKAPFIEGAEEFLAYLKPTIMIHIASGTPQDELIEIISRRNLANYFEGVYGTPDIKEEIITKILTERNISPENALFVGDAITDYNAARNTKVNFEAVYSESMSDFWREKRIIPVKNLCELKEKYVFAPAKTSAH